jgi:hypothetical protein
LSTKKKKAGGRPVTPPKTIEAFAYYSLDSETSLWTAKIMAKLIPTPSEVLITNTDAGELYDEVVAYIKTAYEGHPLVASHIPDTAVSTEFGAIILKKDKDVKKFF